MRRKKNTYSKELGIDLKSRQEAEFFKWFLACFLFGKPTQQEVAMQTYFEFVRKGLICPKAILDAGWDKLVEVLDRGHYVRYDFSTATKPLEICKALRQNYGTLTNLIHQSKNLADLSRRLQKFKGIGPVTSRIFLRDLKTAKLRFEG